MESSAKCQPCGAGTYGNGCKQCAKGQYRNGSDPVAAACRHCPTGYYSDDVGQGSCLPCIPGEYNAKVGAINCTSCQEDSYSTVKNRAVPCDLCAAGRTSEPGSTKCSACAPGQFQKKEKCHECPIGFAQSKTDKKICTKCTKGSEAPTLGSSFCTSCELGKFNVHAGQNCSACPRGFYQDTKGKVKCIECALGEAYINAKSPCSKCDLGQYGSSNGTCAKCLAGRYQDGKGETACKQCDVDTYLSETGKSSKADCAPCSNARSTGTTTGNTNASACLCKRIEYYQHNSKCEPCPDGADCSLSNGITLPQLVADNGFW